jgi:UDP-3-O-[3-hydroxymyristoyl] glucosamine N-acyltransferase
MPLLPVRRIIPGHLTIGNYVTAGSLAGDDKLLSDGEVASSGSPSRPPRTWLRVQRVIPILPVMKKKKSVILKNASRNAETTWRTTHGRNI